MKNTSFENPIEYNEQIVYKYDSLSGEGASAYESSSIEYPVDINLLNYKELSDEELIRYYLEKEDESAFNEIVDRYGWKIHRLAFRITHNMYNADDVLQEVFLILVKKLGSFRKESKFSTWLYKIAANTSYSYLRQQKKYTPELSLESYETYDNNGYLDDVDLRDWSFIPEDILIRSEEKLMIEKAVSEMSEIYRAVFHLSFVEGHTKGDIGEILGISLPAVKSRLRRARMFLKDKLSDNLSNL